MKIEIANSMYGYFETLYIMNQNLIRLCGTEIFYYRFSEFEKLTLDIIQDIPRLIPYSYDIKKQDLILDNSNGLLEYQAEIKYINILDIISKLGTTGAGVGGLRRGRGWIWRPVIETTGIEAQKEKIGTRKYHWPLA